MVGEEHLQGNDLFFFFLNCWMTCAPSGTQLFQQFQSLQHFQHLKSPAAFVGAWNSCDSVKLRLDPSWIGLIQSIFVQRPVFIVQSTGQSSFSSVALVICSLLVTLSRQIDLNKCISKKKTINKIRWYTFHSNASMLYNNQTEGNCRKIPTFNHHHFRLRKEKVVFCLSFCFYSSRYLFVMSATV